MQDSKDLKVDPVPTMNVTPGKSRKPWLLLIVLLLILLGGGGWYAFNYLLVPENASQGNASGSVSQQNPPGIPAPSQHGQEVSLGQAGQASSTAEQEDRKSAYGISDSLDVIVRSDESIVVNDRVIPMSELERQLNRYRGELSDQGLDPAKDTISAWGAYLVRPGDNLWHIHLNL